MNKIILSWIVLFLYMFFIFYLSSKEQIDIIDQTPKFYLKDKLFHIVEYGFLGLLTYNAFRFNKFLNEKIIFYSIMFATIYGISDEMHQLFILNREFSFFDIFADFLGSCLILIKKKF